MKLYQKIYFVAFTALLLLSHNAEAQLNKYYFFTQARNQIADNHFTEAIATLNELLRADGKIAEAWYLRGLAKYNLNDLHGSLADFSQAISQNPVFSQALLYRGIVLGQLSRYSQAQPDFDMAIDLRPNWGDAYFSRGVNYLLGQQPLLAVQDFTRVIDFDPKNVDAWINRGTSYLYSGDSLRALTDYGQASKINPFYSESYSKRGRLLMEMKNYHLSHDDLSKAIELDSTSSLNFFFRALVRNYLGNPTGALDDMNRSIRISPNNALSIYNRALINWRIGNNNLALDDFNRVVELNPENMLVYYNRGILQLERSNYQAAIVDFSQAIQIFPDFANAYKARSSAHAQMGSHKESALDRSFAQSIAERYRENHNQPLTDTSSTFSNLIAFSSDFSPRTTNPLLDEMDSKPIDILPFMRITTVNAATLKMTNQNFTPLDSVNQKLKVFGLALTFGTSLNFLDVDENMQTFPFVTDLLKSIKLSSEKKYNQAIEEYRNTLKRWPNNPLVMINLSVELADMVSFIASFEKDHNSITFSQSAEKNKNSLSSNNIQLESFSESMEMLGELKEVLNNHPVILYNIGNIYALSNQIDQATRYYSQAIEQNAGLAEAWYNRGLIHFMLKENQQGCIDMGKAGELGIRQAYLLIHRFCRR